MSIFLHSVTKITNKTLGRMEWTSIMRLLPSLSTPTGTSHHSAPLSFRYVSPYECFDNELVDQVDFIKLALRTQIRLFPSTMRSLPPKLCSVASTMDNPQESSSFCNPTASLLLSMPFKLITRLRGHRMRHLWTRILTTLWSL